MKTIHNSSLQPVDIKMVKKVLETEISLSNGLFESLKKRYPTLEKSRVSITQHTVRIKYHFNNIVLVDYLNAKGEFTSTVYISNEKDDIDSIIVTLREVAKLREDEIVIFKTILNRLEGK